MRILLLILLSILPQSTEYADKIINNNNLSEELAGKPYIVYYTSPGAWVIISESSCGFNAFTKNLQDDRIRQYHFDLTDAGCQELFSFNSKDEKPEEGYNPFIDSFLRYDKEHKLVFMCNVNTNKTFPSKGLLILYRMLLPDIFFCNFLLQTLEIGKNIIKPRKFFV